MATGSPLHLPSDSITSSGTPEDTAAKSGSHFDSPMVAVQSMVLNDPVSISGTTVSATTVTHDGPSGTHPPLGSTKTLLDRVEVERRHLLALGLSEEVIAMLLASQRDSTVPIMDIHGRPFQVGALCTVWTSWLYLQRQFYSSSKTV